MSAETIEQTARSLVADIGGRSTFDRDVKWTVETICMHVDPLKIEISKQNETIKKLRNAITTYTACKLHDDFCNYEYAPVCVCGLDKLKRVLKEVE